MVVNFSNQRDFVLHLKDEKEPNGETTYSHTDILGKTISEIQLEYFSLYNLSFTNCVFRNCNIINVEINGVFFENCTFEDASFSNVTIMDCSFENCSFSHGLSNIYLGMTSLSKVEFNNYEFQYTIFSDCLFENILFHKGDFINTKFESGDHFYASKTIIEFRDTSLQIVTFIDLDLSLSKFRACELSLSFVECILSSSSFVDNRVYRSCNIDLSTIQTSEILSPEILKAYFGITNPDIKATITESTTESVFHSVFISYSFNDAVFGDVLNKSLIEKGVKTFFWQSDAPGAKKLKKIMSENIRDFDKFLFIASEHSLRSEACHYEIEEARIKYYKTWRDIFVPIHVDKYLFKINKYDIPQKYLETYWANIEELKGFNSLDFSSIKDLTLLSSSTQFINLLNSIKISSA